MLWRMGGIFENLKRVASRGSFTMYACTSMCIVADDRNKLLAFVGMVGI